VLAGGEVLVKPRLGWLLVAVLWLHQVAIAFLSPLSAQDWAVAINGPSWRAVGRFYHWAIVKSHLVHVIVTPLLVIALPLGLATLARGRRLRADGEDTLLVAVIASALWLAVPKFGLACSYRQAVATHVLGLTAAVWYVIWLRAIAARARAGGAIGTRATAGLALAGAAVGSTTWTVSIATLVACAVILSSARGSGARWGAAALGGLIAGAALARWSEVTALLNHIHALAGHPDSELQAFDSQLRAPGWVGAGAATIWLAHTAWRQGRSRAAMPLADHDLDAILRATGFALATAVTGLAVTEFTSFQAIAPGAAVAVIAAIVVVHLAGTGRARFVIVGLALAIQALMITISIHALLVAHRQFDERVAALRRAPRGTIATVAPYPPDSWTGFFGEDFQSSGLRDRVATLTFGLRGIAFIPARREFQDVPPLALHHEVDGDASGFPSFYSADLATARRQFTLALRPRGRRARLVVDHVAVPDRPGEPVLAAWTDAAERVVSWTLAGRESDREGRLRLIPSGNGLDGDGGTDRILGMWSFDLATGAAQVLWRGDDGVYRLPVGHRMNAGVVACTAERCALLGVLGLR
jgi:hypothetical protein